MDTCSTCGILLGLREMVQGKGLGQTSCDSLISDQIVLIDSQKFKITLKQNSIVFTEISLNTGIFCTSQVCQTPFQTDLQIRISDFDLF